MKPGIIGLNNRCHFVDGLNGGVWLNDVKIVFTYHCDSIESHRDGQSFANT